LEKRERLQDSIQFSSQESEIYETKPNTKKVPNLHLVLRVEYQFSKYIFLLIGVVPLMGGSWQTSKETTLLSQEIRQTQFCPNELPTYKTDENPKAHYTLWWSSKLFLTNCILKSLQLKKKSKDLENWRFSIEEEDAALEKYSQIGRN
jgi:hypothetical protein